MGDKFIISGIQQMGIGVPEVYSAWQWYKEHFGVNLKLFDEKAIADIMAPYMGGAERERHAILTLNLQGGGGFEIWQHLSHDPNPASFDILPGDLGIFACKIKSKDIIESHRILEEKDADISPIFTEKTQHRFFYLRDPYKNLFQIIEGDNSWFMQRHFHCGGVYGGMIGTQDMEKSIAFYKNILGYDVVLYDEENTFDDFSYLGTSGRFRRVLLTHSQSRQGSFSKVLGNSQIELVQSLDRTDIHKIFEGRMWGDMGFIQLCFDITNMSAVEQRCQQYGYPFTIDSRKKNGHFDMGEATGHFAYNEDPSGTLIEYVETEKIPLVKKIGLYLNLNKFNRNKPLSNCLLKLLKLMEQ